MKVIYQFEKSFCDKLISIIDRNACYPMEFIRIVDSETEYLHPNNALRFDIPINCEENSYINNVIKKQINNCIEIKNQIEIADNCSKYTLYKFQNAFVFMVLLNNNYVGGRMSIDNQLVSFEVGEMIQILPNQYFNLEKIINGERYCLVSYVDVENKKEKSII